MKGHASSWWMLLVVLMPGMAGCGRSGEKAVPGADAAPDRRPAVADSAADLAGTSWRLVKFEGGDETLLTPDDPSKYTLTFAPDGRLTARIDCNRGTGTWRSSGPPQLEFGPLALTRAMCPPGSLHDRMVKQLPYVRSYVLRDGHLYLSLMADGGIYEFEPDGGAEGAMKGASKGTATSLEHTYWKLTHLDGTPVPPEFQQAEPHLVFTTQTGRVTGSGGCNRVSGTYKASGDRLELSRMVGTMMACEKGMETERAFLQALGRVDGWRISGRTLDLLDGSGTEVARFEGLPMK